MQRYWLTLLPTTFSHGGPIAAPKDAKYVLEKVNGIHGFFGASSMERLPVEEAITSITKEFKSIAIGR